MFSRKVVLLSSALLAAEACRHITIEPPTELGEQTGEIICSRATPQGTCPDARSCREGVCVRGDWCGCGAEQSCFEGACVALTGSEAIACSESLPTGACASNEVCSGGHCTLCEPNEACSATRPRGCCPSGAACEEGVCYPIAERPCAPSDPGGRCPQGYACSVAGSCELVECSPTHPTGACPIDQVCRDGACTPLPCGLAHPAGSCSYGNVCTASGQCVPPGRCASAEDCDDQQKCSADGLCIGADACADHRDCPRRFVCSGERCVRNYLCPRGQSDCLEGEYCAQSGTCLAAGTCADAFDCGPGHVCNKGECQLSGTLCAGHTDCEQGERCSAAGSCIGVGACIDDSDCPAGYFGCVNFRCTPKVACAAASECPNPAADACLNGECRPTGVCARANECHDGQYCGPDFSCHVGSGCGFEEFQTSLVPPNMMIVLDRSGSMDDCILSTQDPGSCSPGDAYDCPGRNSAADGQKTRWESALYAIDSVLSTQGEAINFGLMVYPAASAPAETCSSAALRVALRPNAHDEIMTSLCGLQSFVGATPTGPALQGVADNLPSLGLAATDRDNYVLLLTDGAPNCLCSGSVSGCDASDRVNDAVSAMRAASPSVKTFVVGFASGASAISTLNCNAVRGGTQQCAETIDSTSCASYTGSPRCFYEADDPNALASAFEAIAGQVQSCTYALAQPPPDPSLLFVYKMVLDQPTLLAPGVDWTLDATNRRVHLLGRACDDVRSQRATIRVIYGCQAL